MTALTGKANALGIGENVHVVKIALFQQLFLLEKVKRVHPPEVSGWVQRAVLSAKI